MSTQNADGNATAGTLDGVLPPSPWKLVPGYTVRRTVAGVILMVVGVLAAVAYAIWSTSSLRQFLAEREVWDAPSSVEAPATFDGRVTTRRLIFKEHQLEVTYPVEADGTTRTEPLELDTLFSDLDEAALPRVRYDPQNPGRFALNVAVLAGGGRWASSLFMLVAGVLLVGGSIAFLGWAVYVGARRARLVAAQGVPVACAVTGVEEQVVNGIKTGAIIYRFQVPEAFGGKRREVVFKKAEGTPLWIEEAQRLVVCLVPSNPKVFLALRHDLFPLSFPPGTADAVWEKLGAAKDSSSTEA